MEDEQRRIFRAKRPTIRTTPIIQTPPVSLIELLNDMQTAKALQAIQNNNFIENERDDDGNTPLILACVYNISEVALALIASGKSEPDHISYEGNTALIMACINNMKPVIKKLLETGKALLEHTNAENATALILASSNPDTEDITMEMIRTGKSVPEQVDIENETALSRACQYELTGTALELLKTGKSNLFVRNNSGYTPLDYAIKNDMDEVVDAMHKIGYSEITINLNDTGFNPIEVQEEVVKGFLLDDPMNVCFKYGNKNYLTNRSYINKQMENKVNIKHKCIFAGENKYDANNDLVGYDYTADKNIRYDEEYFSMNALIGLPILVRVDELESITENSYATNAYYLSPSGSFPAIISVDYINGGSGVGADHCQTGKKTEKCSLIPALVTCTNTNADTNADVKPILTGKTNMGQETSSNLQVKIQYKTKTLVIPIEQTTTIGQLKELLLEKLVNENELDNTTNKNVRLIYTGKIYGDDKNEMVVSSLPNFASGITMASNVRSVVVGGGKKRMTKKKSKKSRKSKRNKRNTRSQKKRYTKSKNKNF